MIPADGVAQGEWPGNEFMRPIWHSTALTTGPWTLLWRDLWWRIIVKIEKGSVSFDSSMKRKPKPYWIEKNYTFSIAQTLVLSGWISEVLSSLLLTNLQSIFIKCTFSEFYRTYFYGLRNLGCSFSSKKGILIMQNNLLVSGRVQQPHTSAADRPTTKGNIVKFEDFWNILVFPSLSNREQGTTSTHPFLYWAYLHFLSRCKSQRVCPPNNKKEVEC